jgi:FG-GAP-like repeat
VTSIVVADLNGDKKPDVAVSDDTAIFIFPGNGNGTFQAPGSVAIAGSGQLHGGR